MFTTKGLGLQRDSRRPNPQEKGILKLFSCFYCSALNTKRKQLISSDNTATKSASLQNLKLHRRLS